jgi:type II secretory pathway component GspD/PulD (secretin)
MKRLIALCCGIALVGLVAVPQVNGQAAGGKQEKTKAPAERAEVKVFALKHLDASEMIAVLQQLFSERELRERELRLACHKPTNTLLAVGSAERLALIEVILTKLEDGGKKADNLDIKIITLKNAQAQELTNTLQQLFQERSVRIIADSRSNTILISAAAPDDLQAIMTLIKKLDDVTEKAPANGAAP